MGPPRTVPPLPVRPFPRRAFVLLTVAVVAGSLYANLSFAVTNPADYRYFPLFRPGVNLNQNGHLATRSEYGHIARALTAGRGFADPFPEPTGPTAWMPPALPVLLAGLLWACRGNADAVMLVVVCLQVHVLIATALLVLAVARRTTRRVGGGVAAAAFGALLLVDFRVWFQFTHDPWLVLLALDVLLAGLCWCRPLGQGRTAAGWGVLGGLGALVSPVVGLTWAGLTFALGVRDRAWKRFALAVLVAGLVVAPWTVRNYRVFGRWIPVKSNLAYELYQSECLQPEGLLRSTTFRAHPNSAAAGERAEYKALGETAFLDRKREQFWQAVRAEPLDFLDRTASRFLGATVWYVPMNRADETGRPWAVRLTRLIHPLPFLALVVLLLGAVREPLHRTQWLVIGLYVLYLLPYVCVSYYERYAAPLLGVKALLIVWAADRLLALRFRGGGQTPERTDSCPASGNRQGEKGTLPQQGGNARSRFISDGGPDPLEPLVRPGACPPIAGPGLRSAALFR
jgi:hypothetical protein